MRTSWLVFAALLGCSSSRDFPEVVHIDARWSDAEATSIEAALTEWDTATCTAHVTSERGWTGQHGEALAIYREDASDHDYMRGVLGTTWGDSVALAEDRIQAHDPSGSGEMLHRVALHEIGHLYGLHHEGTGTMSIDAYQFDCIDGEAVAQFCEIYECACERPTCPTP